MACAASGAEGLKRTCVRVRLTGSWPVASTTFPLFLRPIWTAHRRAARTTAAPPRTWHPVGLWARRQTVAGVAEIPCPHNTWVRLTRRG